MDNFVRHAHEIYITLVFMIELIVFFLNLAILKYVKILFQKQEHDIDLLQQKFDNVSNASRRIEKLCDAINQRTRAHLVAKPVISEKRKQAKDNFSKNGKKGKPNKKIGKSDEKKNNNDFNSNGSFYSARSVWEETHYKD